MPKRAIRTKAGLTLWEEKFAVAVVETGGDASKALRKIMGPARVARIKHPRTIWQMASRLQNRPEVRARVQELAEAIISGPGHAAELARIREAAITDGQYGPAVTAERARGQLAGLYDRESAPLRIQHVVLTAPTEWMGGPPTIDGTAQDISAVEDVDEQEQDNGRAIAAERDEDAEAAEVGEKGQAET